MADFEIAYRFTNNFEGRNTNAKDNGDETFQEISFNFHGWNGLNIIDPEKNRLNEQGNTKNLSESLEEDFEVQRLIKVFYFENFWNAIKGNLITDQSIANEVYDNAVNMGIIQSIKYLQRTLNILNKNQKYYKDINVDGVMSNLTLKALSDCITRNSTQRVLNVLNGYQIKHYLECMEKNPNEKFISWFERVEINPANGFLI